jgi:hypothetical protein
MWLAGVQQPQLFLCPPSFAEKTYSRRLTRYCRADPLSLVDGFAASICRLRSKLIAVGAGLRGLPRTPLLRRWVNRGTAPEGVGSAQRKSKKAPHHPYHCSPVGRCYMVTINDKLLLVVRGVERGTKTKRGQSDTPSRSQQDPY